MSGRRRSSAVAGGGRGPATAPPPGPAAVAPGAPPWRLAVLLALAIASGCMWFLACADFDVWPLAWVAMVPSLVAIERAPGPRRAVLLGWVTGLVANLGGFYWVSGMLERFAHLPLPVALLGLVLLCGYQGIVFALFALVVRRVRRRSAEWGERRGRPLPMALVAPIAMVAFEMLVPFLFPWYLAITQAWVLPVIQIADLTGPVGVTALLMMVNGAIYDLATAPERRRALGPALASAVVLAAALVYGALRLHQVGGARAAAPSLEVGVVQGNVSFDHKGLDRAELRVGQLRDLQRVAAELERDGAELILWTESSYPFPIARDQVDDFDERDARRLRRGFTRPLITGAVTYDAADRQRSPYNSAVLLDAAGRLAARYDKNFLVPFGEYTPLADRVAWIRRLLPRAAGHYSPGGDVVTFPFEHEGATYRLGPMICFEDILPALGRKLARLRPHLLVNLTNDTWYGDTSEPWEHLALSVYRAVELRADLVRAVNSGVSAFVDATGRVHARTDALDPKIDPRPAEGLAAEVRLLEGGHTVYAAIGDLFGWLCVALTLAAVAAAKRPGSLSPS